MQVLKTDIRYIKGIGEKRAGLFYKLGVHDVDALLSFFPRTYQDLSNTYSVTEAPVNEPCVLKATVASRITEHRIRKGMVLYKFTVTDSLNDIAVTVFNNKYIADKLKMGEEYLFYGKITPGFGKKEMSAPLIEMIEGQRIRPIYRQTEGLNARAIEKTIKTAFQLYQEGLIDCLPEHIRKAYHLCSYRFAIEHIHFPVLQNDIEIARKRLIFEELFVLQLGLIQLKSRNRSLTGATITEDNSDGFLSRLPFHPTGAQKRAVKEAVQDMKSEIPMNRLLQGDVGSGKTAVAAALCDTVIKNGFQAAFMAPTEILAEQHYHTLKKLFQGSGTAVHLLTGSTIARDKKVIKEQLKTGEISLIIGTHALLEDSVEFHRLGLVVTDEQHRFGVAQRSALSGKGDNPHLLVMSATPIPRTLALIIYGDLDVSVLDEIPPGRQPIETYYVDSSFRNRIYTFIKKHLDEGRQGYIVCPLVEEGDTELKAAEEYSRQLSQDAFAGYQVALLHGNMKGKDKEQTMRRFAAGELSLLVATTVVEAGVDVPNAVIMVIENAERFGLSQLHQLRGRVGRGQHKSTCILISDAKGEEARQRLEIMKETTDGFVIAEKDLNLRGPGDFFGKRQHGLPLLKIANILTDMDTLKQAETAAKEILNDDPLLIKDENRLLKEAVETLFQDSVQQGFN